ncbi:Elongator complex protein 2 [Caenorhabditis elegans]|uniref:Elongator complex protein 2 n=1 Tax=Caenorhabditis elegans TaxID=6239 RepID=Q9NEW7_CAEEL|nr:Elongator complex protein 2 [Caenorhabditis elegans]CAC35846.4 Elongator complex protein 2 [Caenorhabditis elegans]|eukprot:NP_499648.3 ELongator complex Protein Component [Caenorhabditis elegans]
MKIEEEFISASVNPRSHCLTACKTAPLVAYASSLQIAVQTIPKDDSEVGVIKSTSERRHQKPITVLKRLKSSEIVADEFVTGGVDSRVVLWKLRGEHVEYVADLTGCDGSVGSVCGCVEDGRKVVAAAWVSETSNGFHAWWTSSIGDLLNSTEIKLDHKAFALCLDAISIQNSVLLAVGTSKRFVELYGESADKKSFSRLISVAGHTDWIHSIAFNDNPDHLLVASAGQDTYVRLWAIEPETDEKSENIREDSSTTPPDELTSSANLFSINYTPYRCSSHAVMQGHDDWVHSTVWSNDGRVLLTASSDKTCIIWKEIDNLWRDDVRLGIVGGGQAAGFFAAVFSSSLDLKDSGEKNAENVVISSSYFGGLHCWKSTDEQKTFWTALPMTGGHVGEVRDVDWHRSDDGDSGFLMSVGQDQTTRVFAKNGRQQSYVEIARPQVHGHDMQCLSFVNPSIFVSGAEEKVFRAFRAPKSFVKSLEAISGVPTEKSFGDSDLAEFGACVPALGLSNKPMVEGETVDGEHWEEDAFRAAPVVLTSPPTEDTLQQNTLWPEQHKLYGHGYEVYAVTANPTGNVLATACKSSHVEHSVVMLWSTSNWSKKSEIIGHQLTVTQIAWNPSGTRLLTVSRDRTAKLYTEKNGEVDGFDYDCVWTSGKQHTRIIWACDWIDDEHFVTASRDQKVIVWAESAGQTAPKATVKLDEPVTAIAAVSKDVIVAGLQTGELIVLRFDSEGLHVIEKIGANRIPIDSAVLRLRFSKNGRKLAVATTDAKLRIFNVSQ